MALEPVTAAYVSQLDSLAAETRRRLLAIWDTLEPWSDADIDRFHRIATPLVEAAANVGVDISTTYIEATMGATRPASPLIAKDAAARLYDPLDRIAHLIGNGADFQSATAAARGVVDNLGHDTVYRSARQSIAEVAPPGQKWQRRVTGQSCRWCLSLASAVFNSAATATFGHDRCDCVPVPVAAAAAHNKAIIDAAGGDIEVRKYRQVGQLRKSERTARRRQAQAKAEQLTETDPDRRERLSIREQEWETRAERAAERLALILNPAA